MISNMRERDMDGQESATQIRGGACAESTSKDKRQTEATASLCILVVSKQDIVLGMKGEDDWTAYWMQDAGCRMTGLHIGCRDVAYCFIWFNTTEYSRGPQHASSGGRGFV